MKQKKPTKKNKLFIALTLVTIAGAILRFYNINWDEGYTFHPDERNIDAAVSRIHLFDNLNPEFFAYGGLPIYLYRLTGDIIVHNTQNTDWVHNWGKINLVGRSWSAIFSTLTILAVFLLTKKFTDEKYALLAAFFTSFTPSLIQTAHFAITESLLALLVVLISLTSINLINKPKFSFYVKSGFLLGVATAAKTSAVSFLVFPAMAQLALVFKNKFKISNIFRYLLLTLIMLSLAGIVFLLLSPYTVITWNKFMESMHYESGVVLGTLPVPYTLQFTHTTRYLYQLKNLFWQIGLIAAASIIGAIFLVIKIIASLRKSNKNDVWKYIVLISFPFSYFAYIGTWHTKFIRYMVPIIPFLMVFAAHLLYSIEAKYKTLGKVLVLFFTSVTVFWGLAFFSIYTHGQTRLTASKWIFENIPIGSKILGEHWDDGLPNNLRNYEVTSSDYDIEQMTIYEPDNDEKAHYYAKKLSGGDYIVINSRRLYGTLINLPEKYPLTSMYYKLLFAGQLGYKRVAVISSYPTLLGITINDDASEETFQVYDHPKVIILKNINRFDEQTLYSIFSKYI